MSKKGVGMSIRERRKSLRVKQADLAAMAGVSVNTLYKIERGQANPTLESLLKIAEALGLELVLQAKSMKADR